MKLETLIPAMPVAFQQWECAIPVTTETRYYHHHAWVSTSAGETIVSDPKMVAELELKGFLRGGGGTPCGNGQVTQYTLIEQQ